jgi:hypothetical protein
MAMFKQQDPVTKLRADLAAKTAARDKVASQLREIEAKVVEHRDRARALVLEDDERALTLAENAMRAAQDRSASLAGGLADLDRAIAALEGEIESTIDQRTRAETAREIEKLIAKWRSSTEDFVAVAAELLAVTKETLPIAMEAHGTSVFLETGVTQVPEAMALIIGCLNSYSQRVLSGDAAPTLPRPGVPAPALKLVPPPPETEVFALNALQWTDNSGRLQRIAKWNDVSLPQAAAERALRHGKAAPLTYLRRQELRGHGGLYPQPSWCFDCDAEPAASESSAEPIKHSAFEITTGLPYTVQHSEPQPMPMTGTRSAPTTKK